MQQTNKIIVPISIIIAGGLIALGVYFSGQGNTGNNPKADRGGGAKGIIDEALQKPEPAVAVVAPVSPSDHIRGQISASIQVVEYSDTECPFCKRYHETLTQIFNEYSPSNKVAWVYRHFPLDMHTKAPKEAEATECAQELGGTEAFWKYIDNLYATTPTNNKLDPAELPKIATKLGLDTTAFTTCLNSGKYASKVNDSKNEGFKAGARGTPYTVLVINKGGKTETVPLVDSDGSGLGAMPYASLKKIVDKLLN
jgi:protein-disulfide isomerase